MKLLKFLIVFALTLNTARADTWVGVGGGSYHFCKTCGYNNFNPGLGIQSDYSNDLRLIGGMYYNSYYKASFYGGVSYQPLQYGMLRIGIMGGVVSNYNNLKIPMMALPAVSIEGDNIGIDVLGAPNIGDRTGLITVNFKFKL
jgi:hypothetical protein